jgi:hypothetical protein
VHEKREDAKSQFDPAFSIFFISLLDAAAGPKPALRIARRPTVRLDQATHINRI